MPDPMNASRITSRLRAAGIDVMRTAVMTADYPLGDDGNVTEVATRLWVLTTPEAADAAEAELRAMGYAVTREAGKWGGSFSVTLPAEAEAEAPTLVVIPCSGSKADTARPAGELYTGSNHRMARAAADAVAATIPGARVVILSALHGLVELDTVVAPYDVTMGDADAIGACALADQLADLAADRVIALTPNRYTAALLDASELASVLLTAPLAGCRGIGEQRGRLAALRDGRAALVA